MKAEWLPCWESERRMPAFANPQLASRQHNPFGAGKYLWGNVPAIDVLNMAQNEGIDYTRDIAILFAGRSCSCFRPNPESNLSHHT